MNNVFNVNDVSMEMMDHGERRAGFVFLGPKTDKTASVLLHIVLSCCLIK